nr:sporulation integral membrane protein YtvI [Natronobacillus azotifigens]
MFRFFLLIVVSCLILFSFYYIFTYLYPFVIALLFAWLLNPIISLCTNKLHLSRTIATCLALLTFFLLLTLLISISMVETVQAIHYLNTYVPGYFRELFELLNNWIDTALMPFYERISGMFDRLRLDQQTTIIEQIHHLLNRLAEFGSGLLEVFFIKLTNILLAIPNMLSVIIFILLGTFFFSKDWNELQHKYVKIFPQKGREGLSSLYLQLKKTFFRYVKAQLILSGFSLITLAFGLFIIRVEHPFILALLISLVDLIPLLGTGLCFVPWLIYLFLSGNYALTIQLAILYGVIIIQRQIMEPKIMAEQMGVHPLVVLMIAFGSFQIFGIFGVLLTPGFVIVLQAIQATDLPRQLWHYIVTGEYN